MIAAAALVLFLNAAAPPSAPVEDDATKARAAFQAAEKLYNQALYAEAIGKFEEAYRLKPHPSIVFNIARSYEQLGEISKALRNYREYLKAMPAAKDKETVTEAILNLERRLRDQGVQQLLVHTDPKGAGVVVDGKSCGTTPASVELTPGRHLLNLSMDGFDSIELSFVMPADKSMELSFGLKPSVASPAALPPTKSVETPPQVVAQPAAPLPSPPPPTPPPAVVADAPSERSLRGTSWIPAAVGGALLITGGLFYGMAKGSESRLRSEDPLLANPAERAALASSGSTQQTVAFVTGGVGIAALAAAVTMFFLPSKAATVSVIATPNMAAALVSGEFP